MTKTMLLAGVVFMSSCATEGTDDNRDPVATYVSRTGTTIEIYAEGANAYSVAEVGESGQLLSVRPGDVQTMSPTAIYLESASDSAVPPEVAALTSRLVTDGARFSTVATPPQATPLAYDGCTASSFSASWCNIGDGAPITWCLLTQTTNRQKHLSSIDDLAAGLCVKSGHADYHVTNEVGGDHEWTLNAGNFVRYSFGSAVFSRNWVHLDVTGVTGTYQFAGEAN